MQINGHSVPWSVIVLCISLIANAAVVWYVVNDIKDHPEAAGHPVLLNRVDRNTRDIEKLVNQLQKHKDSDGH